MSQTALEVEAEAQPTAATRVRVALMLARGEQILLGALPCADGSYEYALPSCELAGGESLRDCATAIAGAAVDGTLTNLMFQRVALVPGADAVQEVVLGVYAEVIPGGPDPLSGAPPEPRTAAWRFFNRAALPSPLESASALALRACREQWLAIDLDAKPLPVGFGLSDAGRALREGERPRRAFAVPWRAAASAASASAWLVAALVGLRQRMSGGVWGWGENTQYALLCCAWFAGYWCAQRRAPEADRPATFARGAAGGVLAALLAWGIISTGTLLGAGDPERNVFWVGCWGALLTALFWPKPTGAAALWFAGWAAAWFVSSSVTLPPLAAALYGVPGESRDEVRAVVSQVLDDD
jgi:hypothetical protein